MLKILLRGWHHNHWLLYVYNVLWATIKHRENASFMQNASPNKTHN